MRIDAGNSTTTLLTSGQTFTGEYYDILEFNSISIIATTDEIGTLYVDFSTDRTTLSRSLKLSSGASLVSSIHTLIPVSRYFRVRLVNGSTNQGSMDIQTIYSTQPRIAQPTSRLGSNVNNYSDVLNTRNVSDYRSEVALEKRTDSTTWNKFGYNNDVDTGTEIVASWGGMFDPLTTASTLSIVSSSTDDDDGGIGANSLIVYGVDENRETLTEVITMNGTTPVITTSTWLGVNRMSIYISGTNKVNVGTIDCFDTNSPPAQQGQIPAGNGSTQALIYYTPVNSTSLFSWMLLKANKLSSSSPNVNFKMWVYSAISNSKYLVFQYSMDTAVENHIELKPTEPFIVGESSVSWVEATTDRNNTLVSGRFSLIEHTDF